MDPGKVDNIIVPDLASLKQQQLQRQQQLIVNTANANSAPTTTLSSSQGRSSALHSSISTNPTHSLSETAQLTGLLSLAQSPPPAFSGKGSDTQLQSGLVHPSLTAIGVPLHGQELIGARMAGQRVLGIKRSRDVHGQDYYYRQWRRMKKIIKDLIFINSSVCDEVIRVEEKLARVKEERRYLLRKLLQYQSAAENAALVGIVESHAVSSKSSKSSGGSTSADQASEPVIKKTATKKKSSANISIGSETKKKVNPSAKDMLESLQSKPKKGKSQSNRRTIPPMQLDSLGRPVFPMVLGDLTLHSIGEIVPDRNTFHTHECIYPAGFCSTRVYASMVRPEEKCLYTCKISDCGDEPEFEIAPEEGTDQIFRGATPHECHSQLLQAINAAIGADLVPVGGNGADFFGLTNPVVQNLIQSCPGSKKCPGYKWIKFEINKAETNENMVVGRNDPTISIEAFHKLYFQAKAGTVKPIVFSSPSEHSTNLRSLLTKGSGAFPGQIA